MSCLLLSIGSVRSWSLAAQDNKWSKLLITLWKVGAIVNSLTMPPCALQQNQSEKGEKKKNMTKNIIQLYYKQKKEIQELYEENDDLNQRRWDTGS